MNRFATVALLLALLLLAVGDLVVGAIETGYEAKASSTRALLAVPTAQANGAEVVPAGAYEVPGEER